MTPVIKHKGGGHFDLPGDREEDKLAESKRLVGGHGAVPQGCSMMGCAVHRERGEKCPTLQGVE